LLVRRHRQDPRTGLVIIGFGRRGREWADVVGGSRAFRLDGVVDPDPSAADEAHRRGLRVWDEFAAARAAGAGAAIVASPPHLHARHVLDAAVPALVEKPFALTAHDAAAVARSGVPAVAAMNFRLRPTERAIRAALQTIGAPRVSAIHSTRPVQPAGEPLWDLGVHHLDLLADRAGALPVTVSGEREGALRLRLTWASGAVADWVHHDGASLYHTYQWVEGERGAVTADGDRVIRLDASRRARRVRTSRAPTAEAALLDELHRVVHGGSDGPFGAQPAIETVALVAAAAQALNFGGAVRPRDLMP
jgi:predicted dehydrogenase